MKKRFSYICMAIIFLFGGCKADNSQLDNSSQDMTGSNISSTEGTTAGGGDITEMENYSSLQELNGKTWKTTVETKLENGSAFTVNVNCKVNVNFPEDSMDVTKIRYMDSVTPEYKKQFIDALYGCGYLDANDILYKDDVEYWTYDALMREIKNYENSVVYQEEVEYYYTLLDSAPSEPVIADDYNCDNYITKSGFSISFVFGEKDIKIQYIDTGEIGIETVTCRYINFYNEKSPIKVNGDAWGSENGEKTLEDFLQRVGLRYAFREYNSGAHSIKYDQIHTCFNGDYISSANGLEVSGSLDNMVRFILKHPAEIEDETYDVPLLSIKDVLELIEQDISNNPSRYQKSSTSNSEDLLSIKLGYAELRDDDGSAYIMPCWEIYMLSGKKIHMNAIDGSFMELEFYNDEFYY